MQSFFCAFLGVNFYLHIVYPISIRIFWNRCHALLKLYMFYGGQRVLVIAIFNLLLLWKQFCRYKRGPLQSKNGSCYSCSQLEERISGSCSIRWFHYFPNVCHKTHNTHNVIIDSVCLNSVFCFVPTVGCSDQKACTDCSGRWYCLPYVSAALQGKWS